MWSSVEHPRFVCMPAMPEYIPLAAAIVNRDKEDDDT